MKFLGQSFQKLEHETGHTHTQTDRQTDATEHITTAAFTGGKKLSDT